MDLFIIFEREGFLSRSNRGKIFISMINFNILRVSNDFQVKIKIPSNFTEILQTLPKLTKKLL